MATEESRNAKIEAMRKEAFNTYIVFGRRSVPFSAVADRYGVSKEQLMNVCETYYNSFASWTERIAFESMKQREKDMEVKASTIKPLIEDSKYNGLFKQLLGMKDKNSKLTLISESRISNNVHIYEKIADYTLTLPESEQNSARESLATVFDEYFKNLREKMHPIIRERNRAKKTNELYLSLLPEDMAENLKRENITLTNQEKEELLSKAKRLIKDFIGNYLSSKEEFCASNNIDISYFDRCLALVERTDEGLYRIYLSKIETTLFEKRELLKPKVALLLSCIKNGIPVDENTRREFDLIDYYQIIGEPFEDIADAADEFLISQDPNIIRAFVSPNFIRNDIYQNRTVLPLTPNGVSKMLDGSHTVKKDGIVREITSAEKQYVVDFLNSHSIPISEKTYSIAMRRYLKGQLVETKIPEERDNIVK